MNEAFAYGLAQLDMVSDANHSTGLVSVSALKTDKAELQPEEIIALENAVKYQVDYVYFRKFRNRPSVVQVYIYDYTENESFDKQSLIQLHQKLYSSGLVPMFFVFTKSDVVIFNCLEKPAEKNEFKYKPFTTIKLVSVLADDIENRKKIRDFSGKAFDNGAFWEDSTYSSSFKSSNGAYEKLLAELKQALRDIISKQILPANIARKFMVISILIKYLEDRIDNQGNSVFPSNFFEEFLSGARSFIDILLDSEATVSLLDHLSSHFGGEVFRITDEERQIIVNNNLTRFSQFLRGDMKDMQFLFWKLYSFNDLPIELISNIYEEFLGKKTGVVYTPPYLVNFLLDEAMPLSDDNTDFKVLDPACGSGVFLVGAYKRLIQRWRKKNNWAAPDLRTLKSILVNNIYGIDKDGDATNLTIFSLSLALCDALTPKQIWEELQFDNLKGKNIFNDDFFNVLLTANKFDSIGFDLVIGNPPFDSSLTSAARKIENLEIRRDRIPVLLEEYPIVLRRNTLPDSQIALLFLEQSIRICKPKGLTCLIQPAGPLLYNNSSSAFRKYLLSRYYTPQVIDFTHISRTLFGKKGDVATAAIFVRNEPAHNKGLFHITVRRTKPNKEKLYFELDSYDFHYIPYGVVVKDDFIWKANFLGGHRYHQLISRLSEYRTLGEYLSENESRGWVANEGFTLATKNDIQLLNDSISSGDIAEQLRLENKYSAPFLTGKKFLPTEAFNEKGIEESNIQVVTDKHFHSTGEESIYSPPHILLKEIVSNDEIPVLLSNEYITFRNSIIGIHAPVEDYSLLQELARRLYKNKIYPFYIAATSGRYMINKSSSFLKTDVVKLPYPVDEADIELDYFEQILIDDFTHFLLKFRREGENSRIAEEDVSQEVLVAFGETYCQVLNSVYKSIKPYDYFEMESFICYPFYFGDKPKISFEDSQQAEKHVTDLAKVNYGLNVRIIRVIRMYEHNTIYMIKPRKMRYWLQSIALRDADETFTDLRKQGY